MTSQVSWKTLIQSTKLFLQLSNGLPTLDQTTSQALCIPPCRKSSPLWPSKKSNHMPSDSWFTILVTSINLFMPQPESIKITLRVTQVATLSPSPPRMVQRTCTQFGTQSSTFTPLLLTCPSMLMIGTLSVMRLEVSWRSTHHPTLSGRTSMSLSGPLRASKYLKTLCTLLLSPTSHSLKLTSLRPRMPFRSRSLLVVSASPMSFSTSLEPLQLRSLLNLKTFMLLNHSFNEQKVYNTWRFSYIP